MTEISVTNQKIKIISSDIVVSGTVSCVAHFSFSDEWDHLAKTALFRPSGGKCSCYHEASDVYSATIDDDGHCKIPVEVLTPGGKLEIGVYGVGYGIILPTVWSNGIAIRGGAA